MSVDNEAPCSHLSPTSSIQSVPFTSADLSSPIPPLILVQIILRFTVKKKGKAKQLQSDKWQSYPQNKSDNMCNVKKLFLSEVLL